MFCRVGVVFLAYGYLAAAGLVWLAEGFLFSRFLGFLPWQVGVMVVLYLALFGYAVRLLGHGLRTATAEETNSPAWRLVSLAPMLAVIVGSFASLPILLLIAVLGRVL